MSSFRKPCALKLSGGPADGWEIGWDGKSKRLVIGTYRGSCMGGWYPEDDMDARGEGADAARYHVTGRGNRAEFVGYEDWQELRMRTEQKK